MNRGLIIFAVVFVVALAFVGGGYLASQGGFELKQKREAPSWTDAKAKAAQQVLDERALARQQAVDRWVRREGDPSRQEALEYHEIMDRSRMAFDNNDLNEALRILEAMTPRQIEVAQQYGGRDVKAICERLRAKRRRLKGY